MPILAHGITLFNPHHLKYFLNELLKLKNQVTSHTSLNFLVLFEISDDLKKWTWHSRMAIHGWSRIVAPFSWGMPFPKVLWSPTIPYCIACGVLHSFTSPPWPLQAFGFVATALRGGRWRACQDILLISLILITQLILGRHLSVPNSISLLLLEVMVPATITLYSLGTIV